MHNWKNTILKVTGTIEDAINTLDQESLRIVMVVDDSDRLVGTVTDGDIRRGLIRHLSLDEPIVEIMFKTPTVALEKDSKESVLLKMKELDLLQIPIVNSDSKIVGLETLQHLIEGDRLDNPVFLMAGGFGKRLQPLTDNTPKPLLKVGTKPILENILNQFIAAGFHNFYISTHYKAEMVRNHFGNGSDWGVSITYLHEETPLGTAGSLGLLPKKLIDLPILIMNGDLLTKIDFKELLGFHLEEGGDATMCTREYDFQVPYGVIKTNGQYASSIVEKPIHKFFVNAGIYVVNPAMLEIIDGVSYLDMPDLLQKKIDSLGQVNVFPVHEYWLDIGQMEQFDQAHIDIVSF
ncbi:MAG: nucleotidyltransferase family protein [Candidatus Brocadiales bacterium]|nr:nucleotidyltransferase family protein [Candidatus Brocadiales bacterium]